MISKKYSLDKNRRPLIVYDGIDSIPMGHASSKITEGCLVLEGGAWRGLRRRPAPRERGRQVGFAFIDR